MPWQRTPAGWRWIADTPRPPAAQRIAQALRRDTGCSSCNRVRRAVAAGLDGGAKRAGKRPGDEEAR